jgi:hypothetical protein
MSQIILEKLVNKSVNTVKVEREFLSHNFGNGNKTHSAFSLKFPCIRHSPYIQTRFENVLNTMKN